MVGARCASDLKPLMKYARFMYRMGSRSTNMVSASVMAWMWSVKTLGSGQPSMWPMPM